MTPRTCSFTMYNTREGYDVYIFPNCVKMLTTSKIRATEQSLHDRNKIANEWQVNNCDIRIDQDMCTFVIM